MAMNFRGLTLCGLLLLPAGPAFAVLGGDRSSIDRDLTHMKAARRVLPGQSFSVHEMQTPAGTVVREFIGLDGKVFAVAWKGPQMPDLQQLFGQHFVSYQQLASAQRANSGKRGGIAVESPGLVVQSGGRMRAFHGRAYLPTMVPAGVALDEIK